jgi:hypothetical protein
MRKFALLAASSAGALFTILVQADAMTFSNKTSVLDIVASADTVKPETKRQPCGRRAEPSERT